MKLICGPHMVSVSQRQGATAAVVRRSRRIRSIGTQPAATGSTESSGTRTATLDGAEAVLAELAKRMAGPGYVVCPKEAFEMIVRGLTMIKNANERSSTEELEGERSSKKRKLRGRRQGDRKEHNQSSCIILNLAIQPTDGPAGKVTKCICFLTLSLEAADFYIPLLLYRGFWLRELAVACIQTHKPTGCNGKIQQDLYAISETLLC